MSEPTTGERRAAFFDLDGTLTHQDTTLLWLVSLFGWPATLAMFAASLALGPFRHEPDQPDLRARIKSALFALTLDGVDVARAAAAGADVAQTVRWNRAISDRFRWHRAEGHHVVIATASPGIYLPTLLADLGGYDSAISTTLEVSDGKLTGRILGANNARDAKTERVRAYLADHGPFTETWGYGNAPHDLGMLAQMTHATVV